MRLELLNLCHARVLPQDELVFAKAMGRTYLLLMFRPDQGAHLTSGIDGLRESTRRGVPEFDSPVGRATSTCKETPTKWTPVQGFRGSLVLCQQ